MTTRVLSSWASGTWYFFSEWGLLPAIPTLQLQKALEEGVAETACYRLIYLLSPQVHMLQSPSHTLLDVTLFGNKVVADVLS